MKKGDVWLVEFPSINGHEQAGTRPVIMLADSTANIAVVVPLTSNLLALRFPQTIEVRPSKRNGLSAISVALVFQIRAVDKKRLKNKIGEVEEQAIAEVDSMLRKMLNL